MIHQKMSAGRISQTKQLRNVSVPSWAERHAGVTETRDQREIATLAAIMDAVNGKQLAEAVDIFSQRIVANQRAKARGSSWSEAENLELVLSNSGAGAIAGMLNLST